jgi:hypothetical protein
MDFGLVTTEELLEELDKRYEAVVFAAYVDPGQDRPVGMHPHLHGSVIQVMGLAAMILATVFERKKNMEVDPEDCPPGQNPFG